MNFRQMQDRLAQLLELGGFTSTKEPPLLAELLHRAYAEYVWETDTNWVSNSTLLTVAEQAEYTLPGNDWKIVQDVYWGDIALDRTSPYVVRKTEPHWLLRDSSNPIWWWPSKDNVIRLYPKPSDSGTVLTIFGMQLPADLENDEDVPIVPKVHHEDIVIRAYWFQAELYARGDERIALLDQITKYRDRLVARRVEFHGSQLANVKRSREAPQAEFVRI